MKVLYVDDDPFQRTVVTRMLVGAGHDVTTVASVEEFTAAYGSPANRGPFDVLVCDHDLGDADTTGLDLLVAARADVTRILFSGAPPRHIPAGITCVTKDQLSALVDAVGRAGRPR